MTRVLNISLFLVLTMTLPLFATIRNVPSQYSTIQQGIFDSYNGDTVLVQPGIYTENIDFYGHNSVVGSLFLTTGDTSYISSTIIDGDSSGPVVVFLQGEDSTAVLTGFTIRNGYAYGVLPGGGINCSNNSNPTITHNTISGNSSTSGGAIYCVGYSIPNISYNTISDNYAMYVGGGIYCGYSNAIIENNVIRNNITDGFGSGIYCINSDATISDNIITENTGSHRGGGIDCANSDVIISDNIISENTSHNGGGIWLSTCNPIITNNTISGNIVTADESQGGIGGGIYCGGEVSGEISNNTITANYADSYGGGIYCSIASNPSIRFNTISENSASAGAGIYCYNNSSPVIGSNIIEGNNAINYGGGIYCWLNANPTVINNTIYGNSAAYGGGLYSIDAIPFIVNTILWADSASTAGHEIYVVNESPVFSYCNIQGGWPGAGNINIDPLIQNPLNSNFHLMAYECGDPFNSPCIDTGHPGILDSMLNCNWGYGGQRSDIGAYGGSITLPLGKITGIIYNQEANPISDVHVTATGTSVNDSSDANGVYQLDNLIPDSFNVSFSHLNYRDTVITGVVVAPGETIYLSVVLVEEIGCNYTIGDANNSGSYNGLDITYGVAFFKGGPDPLCEACALCSAFFYCGDVNGSCSYNGLDITYGVEYLKGGPAPIPCPDCPPVN